MAHPRTTELKNGRKWHLEDTVSNMVKANALAEHLIKTEEKKARISRYGNRFRVWWAKGQHKKRR
jgi:hypothetical protein